MASPGEAGQALAPLCCCRKGGDGGHLEIRHESRENAGIVEINIRQQAMRGFLHAAAASARQRAVDINRASSENACLAARARVRAQLRGSARRLDLRHKPGRA